MKRNPPRKTMYLVMRSAVLIGLVCLVVWSLLLDRNVTIYTQSKAQIINDGWIQQVGNQHLALDTAQEATVPPQSDTIVLERTVPTNCTNYNLLFYATHQNVNIYIDNVLVKEVSCPKQLSFFDSPGRLWVTTLITPDMSGKTLRVEISSPFAMYRVVPQDIFYVASDDIQQVQINFMWVRNTAALVLLGLAVISYLNACLWKSVQMRRFIFTLADVYLFTGLWLFSEINVLSMVLGDSATASLLAMLFVRIIPVTFYHFITSTTQTRSKLMRFLGFLAWSNLFISVICQWVFGVSLVTTMPITAIIMTISGIAYLAEMVYYYMRQKIISAQEKSYYYCAIILIGMLVEMYCYAHPTTHGQWNGVFVSAACLIYAMIAHIIIVKTESKTDVEKRKMEKTYHTLERKPLQEQINAHFLFNTLNAISAYCKDDPQTADQAVHILAQYMRKYMHLVNCGEYVPFQEEVALVKQYLQIQNLRYGDEMVFVCKAECEQFVLPPLTLQPLVENAVIHGLHGFSNDGTVTVTTRLNRGMVEVVVSDNGSGFETGRPAENHGVGLKNLTTRINAMGGSLTIKSKLHKGTNVIIQVPYIGSTES